MELQATFIKNKIKEIKIKKSLNNHNELGHAGFFWIKNSDIFNHLEKFTSLTNLKREIILDDYFKFLFDYKLRNIRAYKLNYYVHIGSINEFEELKYWENYFKHVVK